jgi:hypothetical protein
MKRSAALLLPAILACAYYAGNSLHTITSVRLFQEISPGIVFYSEHYSHPRLKTLLKREKIGALVSGLGSDLEKASALRAWVAGMNWEEAALDPAPQWDALTILDRIRAGKTGGNCGQRGIIFGQACQSLGIPVRYADLASKKDTRGHFIVEVYIKELRKWIVMDPTFNYCVKENRAVLSAREIHERLTGGGIPGVSLDPAQGRPETMDHLGLYYYYRYYLRNDFLSKPVESELIDHGKNGVEVRFTEKRLHLLDVFTRDKAGNSSNVSGSSGDFDWQYRDLGLVLRSGPMRDLLIEPKDPAVGRCLITVNGEESEVLLPFRVKLAGRRENTVIVKDAGSDHGTIITLKPLFFIQR